MSEDLDRLVPLQPEGGKPPLFCVHAVSGSAYAYAGLARRLGVDQPVYGFEAPGFDNDRAPVASMSDLADEYTAILSAFQPGGGYRLLGWSMGGLLIFEMAKRLTAAGAEVSKLILVDAEIPEMMPLPRERDILFRFVGDMMGRSEQDLPELTAMFDQWPADVPHSDVFAAVQKAEVLPEEMDTDLLADQYAVFRAHLEGFLSFDVTGTHHGQAVHVIADQAWQPDRNWHAILPRVQDIKVPGTHYTIWSGQSLVTMSEIIQRILDRA